jgi:hypothetical protein
MKWNNPSNMPPALPKGMIPEEFIFMDALGFEIADTGDRAPRLVWRHREFNGLWYYVDGQTGVTHAQIVAAVRHRVERAQRIASQNELRNAMFTAMGLTEVSQDRGEDLIGIEPDGFR